MDAIIVSMGTVGREAEVIQINGTAPLIEQKAPVAIFPCARVMLGLRRKCNMDWSSSINIRNPLVAGF